MVLVGLSSKKEILYRSFCINLHKLLAYDRDKTGFLDKKKK